MLESIKPIFSEEKILGRIRELAVEIHDYYEKRKDDFWILYLEKGAKVFAEKLQQEIIELDTRQERYQGIFSMTAKRTDGTGFLEKVRLEDFQIQEIQDKNILLVEDIIDQGITLAAVVKLIKNTVNSHRVCVLVDKIEDRKEVIELDHVGFQVTEGWIIGFGMDVAEQGRDLPFIGVMESPRNDS